MDLDTIKWLLKEYGPMVMGWVTAGILWGKLKLDTRTHQTDIKDIITTHKSETKDVLDDYHKLVQLSHEAIVENTKITERLALLIEERTRQRRNGQ